ncbi:MAG: amino acid adenylation domain-containing protein [Planctomycetaceae bacterium]
MAELTAEFSAFPSEQRRIIEKCRPSGMISSFLFRDIEQTIPERFEQQAELYPDRPAVHSAGRTASYAELNSLANQAAEILLHECGEGLEPVGTMVEEGLHAIVTLLGILKAGKIYVPLGTAQPPELIQKQIDAVQPAAIIHDDAGRHLGNQVGSGVRCIDWNGGSATAAARNPQRRTSPRDPADVFFSSGTTGIPKPVAQSHESRLLNLFNMTNLLGFCPEDRLSSLHFSSFGASLIDYFGALLNGASVYCWDVHRRGFAGLASWLRNHRITVLHWVPTPFRRFCQENSDPRLFDSVRALMLGSESVTSQEFAIFRERFPDASVFVNRYGSIQTHNVRYFFADKSTRIEPGPVPCGYEIPGKHCLLLDDEGREVGPGEVGEVVLASRFVMLKDWNRPSRPERSNGTDRGDGHVVAADQGGDPPRYHTGDMGKLDATGCLTLVGRKAFEVKVRGKFVDLSAVEGILAEHPAIKEVAVVALEGAHEGQVAAYFVLNGLPRPANAELRGMVEHRLPQHMIPSRFIELSSLPTTDRGKINRLRLRRLPDEEQRTASTTDSIDGAGRPRTPLEARLAQFWGELLEVASVDIHASFQDLGGDSLKGMMFLNRVYESLGAMVDVTDLFDFPTVATFANHLAEHYGVPGHVGTLSNPPHYVPTGDTLMKAGSPCISNAPARTKTRLPRERRPGNISPVPPAGAISRRSDGGSASLSFSQQRLWFLDQLEPGRAVYNNSAAAFLRGSPDPAALERSLQEIVRRHEALRTTFRSRDGQPIQVIVADAEFHLALADLRALPESERETEARRLAREEVDRPFDLSRDLMLRARLIRLTDSEHLFVLTMHHIASDGWSFGILWRELEALYAAFSAGRSSPLPAVPVQYADYAVWQRGWLQGEVLNRQIAYWKECLAGAPAILELPTDFPRPAVQSYRGTRQKLAIGRELVHRLQGLSRQEDVTLFMTLLTAFQVLLSRYSGQKDVVVGSAIAGRNRKELENMIGFFANTLALRSDLSGDPTFRDLLKRTREVTLGAYAHQDLPFEKLVDELQPERNLSHSPLFQVMLLLQNAPRSPLALPAVTVEPVTIDGATTKFDLTLSLQETAEGLRGSLEYNTDLFEAETIARLIGHFTMLLEGIVADPGRRIGALPLLMPVERQQIIFEWSGTEVDFPCAHCIHELFEAQVERTPDAPAVVFLEQTLTYRELNARANRLAHHLIGRGVRREVLVGLCVERSLEMLVGMLGILKAGGAYVPLDPEYPPTRLRQMMEDAEPLLVLAANSVRERLPDAVETLVLDVPETRELLRNQPATNPPGADRHDGARFSSPAYVIYTSGSTGKPKAVVIEHGALTAFREALQRVVPFTSRHRLLAVTTITFDISVLELLVTLSRGAQVLLASRDEARDPSLLTGLIRRRKPCTMQATPSHWKLLVDHDRECLASLRILTGGEPLPVELARELFATGASVWNLYGPTEATIWASVQPLSRSDVAPDAKGVVSIGRPLTNYRIYVLDAGLELVPVGVPGELYIAGPALARGYLNRPELTTERFLADPFGRSRDERMYRTGDLARWRADGTLEFLGRVDQQVKLRGFRIELGEIEATMSGCAGVAQVVVLLREDRPGDKRLAAYVVPAAGMQPDPATLRQEAATRLPAYMVPESIVFLDKLPLTANGKLDRQSLPALSPVPGAASAEEGPRTELEQTISAIFAGALGIDRVGLDANFFDLGGNSLLAVQVQAQLRKELHVRLPLRSLFETPHVRGLAERIKKEVQSASNANSEPPPAPAPTGPNANAAKERDRVTRSWTSRVYRYLALSDHFVARSARQVYRQIRSASLPMPRLLIRPTRWAFVGLRFGYFFLRRVFICEPIFKSYCRQYGRRLHTDVYIHWVQGNGDIIIGDDVTIDGKCVFTFAARFSENPTILIGDRSGIGHNCAFTVGKQIKIGRRCRIARDVWMFDSGGHSLDPDARLSNAPLDSASVRPIEIGDNVWIGQRSVIFPGVTIGEGSVVTACSVVMSSVPPYSLVSGHPAKVVGELESSAEGDGRSRAGAG